MVSEERNWDEGQKQFLERFADSGALSYFQQIFQGRNKEAGDCWLPANSPRVISWITLSPAQKQISHTSLLEELRKNIGKKMGSWGLEKMGGVAVCLSDALAARAGGWEIILRELSVAVQLASHTFSYSSKQRVNKLQRVDFIVPSGVSDKGGVLVGSSIGRYTNLARRWSEEPSSKLTPQVWAQEAAQEACKAGCNFKVLDVGEIRALGMGGILGVGSGAAHSPKLLVADYQPAQPEGAVALIGKGILFDSGGLQIKTGGGMLNMKYDKAGGAAALAACFAAAFLKAPVRVIAVVPAVYNKVGSDAMHPRDILHMMNGKTVEVQNTDAEGRLVLGDALHYAEKFYSPDVMIDITTLTGACVAPLGCGYAGLMSRDGRLKNDLIAAGKVVGERLWELPLEDSYKAGIDTDMADVANCGKASYGAGSIMGGLFLEQFVQTARWAHLDIAGPAMQAPTTWYEPTGATGFGTRLLIEYIINYRGDGV